MASGEASQLGEHDGFPIPLCGLLPPSPLMLVLGLACCLSMLRCGWCLRRLRVLQACFRADRVCVSWSYRKGVRGVHGKATQSSVWGSALHNRTQAINNASATELCPRKPNFPRTLRSTFQCRSHRKSVLGSVFYHQFPIKNHSSPCPGAPACCLWGNSSPESVLLS